MPQMQTTALSTFQKVSDELLLTMVTEDVSSGALGVDAALTERQ